MGIMINTRGISSEPDYASELEFSVAVCENGWKVISDENYRQLTNDINDVLKKAEISGISRTDLDALEKAMRDRSHLVRKEIINKNGKKTTKWVLPSGAKEGEEGKSDNPHADAIARHEHNVKKQRMSKEKSLAHVERHFGKEAADHIRNGGKKEEPAKEDGAKAPEAGGKKNTPKAQEFLKEAQKRGVKGLEDSIDPEEEEAGKPDGLKIEAPFVGAKEPHQKLANAVFEELREMYEGSDEGDDAVIEFSSDLAEIESVEDIISILDDRGFDTDDTDELMGVIVPAIVNSQPQAKKADGETVLKKVMTDYASEQINEMSDMPASDLRELKRNMKQADTYGEILEAAGFEDMHEVAIGAMMEWAFGKK